MKPEKISKREITEGISRVVVVFIGITFLVKATTLGESLRAMILTAIGILIVEIMTGIVARERE